MQKMIAQRDGGRRAAVSLGALFDCQRFFGNPGLQAKIDAAYEKYLAPPEALPDETLDVSAAGDASPSRGGLSLPKDGGRDRPNG